VTTDAMGSVTSVLSSTGEVLERRSYDAFGQMTCMLPDGTPVATSPTGLKVGFHGQLIDELTGMYQMGYRWYSPVLGRWASRDPIGLEGGVNECSAYGNNPINRIDPLGTIQVEYPPPNPLIVPTVVADAEGNSATYFDYKFSCDCTCKGNAYEVICKVQVTAVIKIYIKQKDMRPGTTPEQIYGHEQRHILSEGLRVERRLVAPLRKENIKPTPNKDTCLQSARTIEEKYRKIFGEIRTNKTTDHRGDPDSTALSPVNGVGEMPLSGSPFPKSQILISEGK
jgi:RHS repeat-associated protein